MSEHEQIEDTGKVVWTGKGVVRVELERGGGCKSCAMRGMCFAKSSPAILELTTDLDLNEGDKVRLEISAGNRIVSSLLIFLMPVVFMFAGFILASLWLTELLSIAVAFLAMALSFLVLRIIDRRLGDKMKIRINEKL